MVDTIVSYALMIGIGFLIRRWYIAHIAKQDRAREARNAALLRLSDTLGFDFDLRSFDAFPEPHGHEWFRLRRSDSGAWTCNTLRGSVRIAAMKCRVIMGDHVTTEVTTRLRRGKFESSVAEVAESYLLVELPFVGTPSLLVRPAAGADKRPVGGPPEEDLDGGTRGFPERYTVTCSDPDFARAILSPAASRALDPPTPPTWLELHHDELLVASAGRPAVWSADDFRQRLEWTRCFCDHWFARATARFERRPDSPGDAP